MNLATFVDCGQLGAPEDVNTQAWEAYIRSIRNQMVNSWNEARAAYLTLQKVRESFGLPLITPAGEAVEEQGALNARQNQVFLDLAAAADFLAKVADDVLAGKRQVGYDSADGMVIELLPEDTMKAATVDGRLRLVNVSDGAPVPVTGTISAVPILVWAGMAAVTALALYYVVDSNSQTMKAVAQVKMLETVSSQNAELVASGKATPEQAAKMTSAVFAGATALETAKGAARESESESGIQGTVRTVMWVALGIGVLYFAAKVIPPLLTPARAAA